MLVGKDGIGPWEDEEVYAALVKAVNNKRQRIHVIPVLLPGASKKPRLKGFLATRTWVDLRRGDRRTGLSELIHGITGIRPDPRQVRLRSAKPTLPNRTVLVDEPTKSFNDARRLSVSLKRHTATGQLRDSEVLRVILKLLNQAFELNFATNLGFERITEMFRTAIIRSDENYVQVDPQSGVRDWQEDCRLAMVPLLVAMAQSFQRSEKVQAALVEACNGVAAELKLRLRWPQKTHERSDLVNAIYSASLHAGGLESDEVLIELRKFDVVGPK